MTAHTPEDAFSRLDAIVSSLDAQLFDGLLSFETAQGFDEQPWLVLGCSDGMGLNTIVAALEAGVLKRGLGVYWEPPHLLELDESGQPVSPIHAARVANAEALSAWARERYDASIEVVSANVILTPPRGLKGEPKGEIAPLPDHLVAAFENVRRNASEDAVVVNSVAFGKWICPREGVDALTVPTVDLDGRIVESSTKGYHPRGYEETLDTMGRNHLALLEAILERGWLGPASLTAFFTWAGGSQSVSSLEGIYGRGALGDAKAIAERDVARFRMDHPPQTSGAHAIVRLPAFLSAALMGIPGGGLFGLVSRRVLESKGLFDDMPVLASKMIRQLFGPEWVRENPISQIELDLAECLYIEEISTALNETHSRIEAHCKETGQDLPLDAQTTARVLDGLIPANYRQLLARFHPGESDLELHVDVRSSDLAGGLPDDVLARVGLDNEQRASEFIEWIEPHDGPVTLTLVHVEDSSRIEFVGRSSNADAGKTLVRGWVEFGDGSLPTIDPSRIGDPLERKNSDESTFRMWLSGILGKRRELKFTYGVPGGEDALAYRRGLAEDAGDEITVINERAEVVAQIVTR